MIEIKDRYSFKEIIEAQKTPLDEKIEMSVEILNRAFDLAKGPVCIAFSGGKDSTVLWHLIKTCLPDKSYKVLYGNTTVEFPECLQFARKLGKEWADDKVEFIECLPARLTEDGLKYEAQKEVLEWLIKEDRLDEILKDDGKLKSTRTLEKKATPEMWEEFEKRGLVWKKGTMMSFRWCCDQYGYPILGKAAGKLTARRINIDCFLRFSEPTTERKETLEYYELIKNVKTSNHCCSILKKEPMEAKQAELKCDVIIKGLMAEESHTRMLSISTRGCIFESSRPHAEKFYHISPLGMWRDADIWEYIHRFDVPYCSLYDMEYTNHKGETCKVKRNGCVGCCTDIAFRDAHISVLRQTHPKRWEIEMKSGLGDQLMALAKYQSNGRINYASVARNIDDMIDRRPCAFDDLGERIISNPITRSDYDPEYHQVDFSEYLAEMEA